MSRCNRKLVVSELELVVKQVDKLFVKRVIRLTVTLFDWSAVELAFDLVVKLVVKLVVTLVSSEEGSLGKEWRSRRAP